MPFNKTCDRSSRPHHSFLEIFIQTNGLHIGRPPLHDTVPNFASTLGTNLLRNGKLMCSWCRLLGLCIKKQTLR